MRRSRFPATVDANRELHLARRAGATSRAGSLDGVSGRLLRRRHQLANVIGVLLVEIFAGDSRQLFERIGILTHRCGSARMAGAGLDPPARNNLIALSVASADFRRSGCSAAAAAR